jgi:hypothetical protein
MTLPSKRVILRIPVNDICDQSSDDYTNIIKAYLNFSDQSADNFENHGIHIEPFQSPELKQTSCHIILDVNKHSVESPNLQEMPHEVYRVRKKDGVL